MKILLDYGHCLIGSADMGEESNGRKEQDCTREIGYKVKAKLEFLGHTVIVCSCDSANSLMESLQYRVNTANKSDGDLFISIHLNAGGELGTEVFTYDAKQLIEANNILDEFVALGFKRRGIKYGSELYVIKNTNMKSILIKCCFIDADDMKKYNAENFANAILKGIVVQLPANTIEKKAEDISILDLQRFCNKLGITDFEGKTLIEDNQDSKRTQTAKIKLKAILQYILIGEN